MREDNIRAGSSCVPKRQTYLIVMSIMAVIMAFYASRGTWRFPFSADPLRARDSAYHNVYALLVEGYLSGKLSLALEPAPALAAADNPYDLVKHQRYYPYDVSYYKGRFYTYYGIAPAVTLFLPVRVALGVYLPQNFAAWLLCVVMLGVQVGLVWHIIRTYLPQTPRGYYYGAAVALAFSIPIPYEITSAAFYEVAIFSCQLWLSVALAAWYAAHARQQRRWYIAASACLVMAVASRPPAAVIAGAALLSLMVQWRRLGWRIVTACTTLMAGGAAGLMWYNYARFKSVVEFGLHYVPLWFEPVLYPWAVMPYTVRLNAWMYLLNPLSVIDRFPYVRAHGALPAWYPEPDKYFTLENTVGLIIGTPFVVPILCVAIGVLLVMNMRRRAVPAWPAVRSALWAAGMAAILLVLLLPIPATTMRYMLDFSSLLVFSASVCAVWIDQAVLKMRCLRLVWRSVCGAGLLYAVCVHLLLGFQGHWDQFRRYNPWLFATLQQHAPRVDELWPARQAISNLYANGALRTRAEMIADTNGMYALRHGLFEAWYPDGTLQQRGRYRRGQPEGRWTWWHANGARAMEGTFRHGVHHGWWCYWNTNAVLTREVFVLEGATIKEIKYE